MNGKRIAGFSALVIGATLALTLAQVATLQTFRLVAMRPNTILKIGGRIICETIRLTKNIAEFKCSAIDDMPLTGAPTAPRLTRTATQLPNFSPENSPACEDFSRKNSTITPTRVEYPAAITPQPYP